MTPRTWPDRQAVPLLRLHDGVTRPAGTEGHRRKGTGHWRPPLAVAPAGGRQGLTYRVTAPEKILSIILVEMAAREGHVSRALVWPWRPVWEARPTQQRPVRPPSAAPLPQCGAHRHASQMLPTAAKALSVSPAASAAIVSVRSHRRPHQAAGHHGLHVHLPPGWKPRGPGGQAGCSEASPLAPDALFSLCLLSSENPSPVGPWPPWDLTACAAHLQRPKASHGHTWRSWGRSCHVGV